MRVKKTALRRGLARIGIMAIALTSGDGAVAGQPAHYDVLIRNGTVYDGTGKAGLVSDVAIRDGRIARIGRKLPGTASRVIDAHGEAVAPGFINMLSWSGESLLHDGLGQSVLRQGVTLEVMGEGFSMGPVTPAIRAWMLSRQSDLRYDIDWQTLGDYLRTLERRGVAVNVVSYVGAATVRMTSLGASDAAPDPAQLDAMRAVVREAMEEGAMGVASSLIYPPGTYASTDEIKALVQEAGRCGGIYATHLRSEGDRFVEAVDEAIDIARSTGTPLEIFHLKVGGRANWPRMRDVVRHIDAARAAGVRVTTDMYVYHASGTGLTASIPPWVQADGPQAMARRLKDPAVRRRVLAEMRDPAPAWDNILAMAGGPDNVVLATVRQDALRPYIGMSLSDIGRLRGTSAEDALLDIVLEDGGRPEAVYFTMSPDTLNEIVGLPYMSFSSDGIAMAPEGAFLKSATHPRSYGNFARVLARYVRAEHRLPLADAIRKMTGLPASVLGLRDRGRLAEGYAADIVVFDPATIQDHADYVEPHRYATGVSHVLVNGVLTLAGGVPTGAKAGQVVRGAGWKGWPDGGCRTSPADWQR